MKYIRTAAIFSVVLGNTAYAGGLERTDQSVDVLFEKGRYLEIGLTAGLPDVSGQGVLVSPGASTGNIGEDFVNFNAAFKDDINDSLSYAIIFDQPYGTNVAYPNSIYFAAGSNAELRANALTGLLQYTLPESASFFGGRFSIYGGPRIQHIDANAEIPFLSNYAVTTDSDIGFGYFGGVAYEKPELGIRVSLTYGSEIKHELDSFESIGGGAAVETTTDIDTPQSLHLEFQTGLNPKTLLFGSVRWVPWSDFAVAPPTFVAASGGNPLASFEDDRITYRLGLGRKITENLSLFGSLGYEETTGSPTTNLTPIDGFFSGTLGGSYTYDRVKLTVGVRYADVGDADTRLNTVGGPLVPAGTFSGTSLWGIGAKLSFDLN